MKKTKATRWQCTARDAIRYFLTLRWHTRINEQKYAQNLDKLKTATKTEQLEGLKEIQMKPSKMMFVCVLFVCRFWLCWIAENILKCVCTWNGTNTYKHLHAYIHTSTPNYSELSLPVFGLLRTFIFAIIFTCTCSVYLVLGQRLFGFTLWFSIALVCAFFCVCAPFLLLFYYIQKWSIVYHVKLGLC